MKITKSAAFILGFYVALIVWWLTIFFSGTKDSTYNLAFAFAYGLIPLFGGCLGILEARHWGMLKSAMGKALIFFSSGLITWGLGEMVWSYYTLVLHVEIPYPSLADAVWIFSWPLWSIGIFFLSFATGAKFSLRKRTGQFQLIIIPAIAIAVSYYLLIIVARQGSWTSGGGILKIFFDFAYPILDIMVLTFSLLLYGLSFKYLGGRFKWAVLIILSGFVFDYLADLTFTYTTTAGTFYNGSWIDLLFTTAMFLLSFGVNSFDIRDD